MHGFASFTENLLVLVKAVEKRRVPHTDLSIDTEAEIVPATDPVTVMQCCSRRVAIVNERFVIASAGAHRAGPARVAVVACADVMRVEELVARFVVDAPFMYISHLSYVEIDEAATKIDIATRANTQQTQAGSASIC